uniref:Uncharacterized protein n=1 Tax=Arundo donax TaxID=35708 RepID=A0A0A9GL77_ARUDO
MQSSIEILSKWKIEPSPHSTSNERKLL